MVAGDCTLCLHRNTITQLDADERSGTWRPELGRMAADQAQTQTASFCVLLCLGLAGPMVPKDSATKDSTHVLLGLRHWIACRLSEDFGTTLLSTSNHCVDTLHETHRIDESWCTGSDPPGKSTSRLGVGWPTYGSIRRHSCHRLPTAVPRKRSSRVARKTASVVDTSLVGATVAARAGRSLVLVVLRRTSLTMNERTASSSWGRSRRGAPRRG